MAQGAHIDDAGASADEGDIVLVERAPLVDRESAAWLTSLVVHAAMFGVLMAVTLSLPEAVQRVELTPMEMIEEKALPTLPQEFVSSDDPQASIGAMSALGEFSALGAAPQFSETPHVSSDFESLSEVAQPAAFDLDVQALEGPELLDSLPVPGAGSVGITGAEGAIDRLTHEILASLEQRPTLVAWLFDESGSLREERTRIRERMRRIYQELGVVEAADNPAFKRRQRNQAADAFSPLLTAVVGFGAEPKLLTRKPTADFGDVARAINSINAEPLKVGDMDPEQYRRLSQENVFTAVGMAAEKFRAYQSAKNGRRRVMIVVFTDEAGDDVAMLDDTVEVCRRLAMPVYVVGRPAPFGRDAAYVKWIDPDPKFDQRPQWAPVHMGPESLLPEALKLRFGANGDDELLDSGFGPYGLTRLCYETGGLYFATHPNRVVGRTVTREETNQLSAYFSAFFDPDVMRRYQPEYVPANEYMRLVQDSAARRALVEAAQMSWTSPLQNVRLRFPKRDEAELARELSVAQRAAALLAPKIDAICQVLLAGEDDRQRETEARWQAGYDLALGRALAVKVRTDGYNVMLAEAKQGMPFKNQRDNTWILSSAEEFGASQLEKLAAKSRSYLERVKRDHQGTPWAMLAERELSTPLGWRWNEGYTPLPPVEQPQGNGRPRPEREAPQGPPRRNPPPL
jgi:hypothetical protein